QKQFEAEKKVAVADTSVFNIQRSILQIQEDKAQRKSQIEQFSQERQELKYSIQDKNQTLEQLQQRQTEVKNLILENQEVLENLRAKSVEENRKLDARTNEHNLLKSLVDSLEGYPDSIKFLKKNPEWNNPAPLLSDIFSVQEGYRTALENVLDGYLNYYVVRNIEEAASAIKLLEKNKKGKANFF